MIVYGLVLLVGLVAGPRALTGAAAADLGLLPVAGTWLASPRAAGSLTVSALAGFVTDQLPSAPNRTGPVQIGARLPVGAVAGAACGLAAGLLAGAPR